jgi:acyl-CoA thioesterase FadM
MGTKSFDMECIIVRNSNNVEEIVAETKVVIVCFDYKSNKTIPVSEERKRKISDYEEVS